MSEEEMSDFDRLKLLSEQLDSVPQVDQLIVLFDKGFGVVQQAKAELAEVRQQLEQARRLIEDYKEAQASTADLTRELDIFINGVRRAESASLCDIVAQLKRGSIWLVRYPATLAPQSQRLLTHYVEELGKKMMRADKKYGHGISWMKDDWESECRIDFTNHIMKGDPRDVGIYSAFLWHHKWPTNWPTPKEEQ